MIAESARKRSFSSLSSDDDQSSLRPSPQSAFQRPARHPSPLRAPSNGVAATSAGTVGTATSNGTKTTSPSSLQQRQPQQQLLQEAGRDAASPDNAQSGESGESVEAWAHEPLEVADPEVFELMEKEKRRQWLNVELIASENFISQAVMEALGSHLQNKYSEGMPGSRYYGGNHHIDAIEALCRQRALEAFGLDSEKWGVNVQPYSCTSANLAVYTGLLSPKDRIMGLDLPSGGHLSHGYYTSSGKKVSAASIFFETLPYKVHPETGLIDFEKMEEKALEYRPRLIICGGSAYPREWDFARCRQIADKCGAILMCDMAHISGLVAAKEHCSPFDFADVVTSTTHKTMRGPRGGIVFFRKGPMAFKRLGVSGDEGREEYDYEDKINFAVFPSLQGGPHNNHTAALAVALKAVNSERYKRYIQQVKRNAAALAAALMRRGCRMVTNGTDNHLMLWDLRPLGLNGIRFEVVCEQCGIMVNKNAVYGDSSSIAPGGVRLGTPALTSRGCTEVDMETIADLLVRAVRVAQSVLREHPRRHSDFLELVRCHEETRSILKDAQSFAAKLKLPGVDVEHLK